MCGRYSLNLRKKALAERFGAGAEPPEHEPRFNIAPGQAAPVVAGAAPRRFAAMDWGLVPAWSREPGRGPRPINARIEGAAATPLFRRLADRQRCLVPADGFYEWRRTRPGRRGTPFLIARRDRAPFALAGLWDRREDADGRPRLSFAILTTEPNDLVRPIHDRMPVLLRPDDEPAWLDPDVPFAALAARCAVPFPAAALDAREVSTYVNAPAHEGPRCAEPPTAGPDLFG